MPNELKELSNRLAQTLIDTFLERETLGHQLEGAEYIGKGLDRHVWVLKQEWEEKLLQQLKGQTHELIYLKSLEILEAHRNVLAALCEMHSFLTNIPSEEISEEE